MVNNIHEITANKRIKHRFSEILRFKDVLYYLSWRDFKVRYKQTIVGVLWAIIRPLVTMIVFVLIFDKLAGLSGYPDTPYVIVVYIAMLPWFMFSSCILQGSSVFITNRNLITKIYFPRIIMPLSNLLVNGIDFIISFGFLLLLMYIYSFVPSWKIIFLPLFVFLLIILIVGINLWVSALNVKYRDVGYIMSIIIQLGLYISPVGFTSSSIPEEWKVIFSLNPMVGIIDGFRWSIIGNNTIIDLNTVIITLCISIILFITGYNYFQANEKDFADII